MEDQKELRALVALTKVPGLGAVKIRKLIDVLGSPTAVIGGRRSDWFSCPGITPNIVDHLQELQALGVRGCAVAEAHAMGVDVIAYTDQRYPKRLLEIDDYPVVLYMQGEVSPADQRCIAVVGTRTASLYGREAARRFGRELAAAGFTVVSGLARGVDTEAHRGALETGRTIAVIGSGLADVYPVENRGLAKQMTTQGALLSEFPMHTPPDRQNFPQRNRIVSAMTEATLLIEAPEKSGAMITMQRAIAQKRPLFALPGRVDMPTFSGNHALIKQGFAALVESATDIVSSLSPLLVVRGARRTPHSVQSPPERSFLSPEEQQLIQLLSSEELSIEQIFEHTHWPMSKLSVLLMGLVLKKKIQEFPGKIFKKC